MALTGCKECKKEISTEAKTCPYCGIDNPGVSNPVVIDYNHRLVGIVVLVLISFLCIYLVTRNEREGYQYTENAGIGENKATDVAKVDQEANVSQSPLKLPKPMEASVEYASPQSQLSSADTPQMMVMRMLEFALYDGGLSHESEIQQTKLQIESLPRPAKGNKKIARDLNAKGLAAFKKGDFKNSVQIFEKARKLDKSDVEIVNNLGFSYLRQGNLDSAQHAITIALTMSPGRATAWENLGEVFGVKGDETKAVACFSNVYRFSKDKLKMNQYMKKLNENEELKNLKQARAKAIKWAEKSYLTMSKKY